VTRAGTTGTAPTIGRPRIPQTRDAAATCDKREKEIIAMAKVVKVIELMSQSPKSWEDAAQGAVEEATKTLRNIRSIYVKEFTAEVDEGKITNYRLNAKVTFDLERG
jgi:flavin-binding protein dodecin